MIPSPLLAVLFRKVNLSFHRPCWRAVSSSPEHFCDAAERLLMSDQRGLEGVRPEWARFLAHRAPLKAAQEWVSLR